MAKLILFLLLSSQVFADSWIDSVKDRVDPEAIEWAKSLSTKKKCSTCGVGVFRGNEESDLLVFISFSVPDSLWVSLSKEMNEEVFVVRGLPGNSFVEFARRVAELKKQGMTAPIQINPKLFDEFEVDLVPSFVVRREIGFDKVTGSLSLGYAHNLLNGGRDA